jgi:xylan 1,4-beta-xylosidase
VLVWHYHDDDVPGPDATVEIKLEGLPLRSGKARIRQYRIDGEHSDAFTAWQNMGSLPDPSEQQYRTLEKAGRLTAMGGTEVTRVEKAAATVHATLPGQAVSLFVLEW